MYKIKYFITIIVILFLTASCSILNKLKEKEADQREVTVSEEKEKTTDKKSPEDLKFYNTYIDVVNKISQNIEELHKSYLEEVPEPKTLKKNSMVFLIRTNISVGELERLIKDYKRSFYENGDLGKLKADNTDMQKEIETDFKAMLSVLEDYYRTASKVMDYYEDKLYEKDISPAAEYDDEMKASYEKYKTAIDKLNSSVKKYKPKREQRDLSKISNPDEKSIAALMNVYENTLDKAETFYEKFEKLENNGETGELQSILSDLEKGFEADKNVVESVMFSDKTKYMKYSFEDYFSKTVSDFIKEAKKFLDDAGNKKIKERDFNGGYDDVVRYYNNMINAYNSSISTLNSYQAY